MVLLSREQEKARYPFHAITETRGNECTVDITHKDGSVHRVRIFDADGNYVLPYPDSSLEMQDMAIFCRGHPVGRGDENRIWQKGGKALTPKFLENNAYLDNYDRQAHCLGSCRHIEKLLENTRAACDWLPMTGVL